jgi:hypothetical protein
MMLVLARKGGAFDMGWDPSPIHEAVWPSQNFGVRGAVQKEGVTREYRQGPDSAGRPYLQCRRKIWDMGI